MGLFWSLGGIRSEKKNISGKEVLRGKDEGGGGEGQGAPVFVLTVKGRFQVRWHHGCGYKLRLKN